MENVIVVYLHTNMLNIGLLHFPLLLDPCFLAFYNCLHNVLSYLFNGFVVHTIVT